MEKTFGSDLLHDVRKWFRTIPRKTWQMLGLAFLAVGAPTLLFVKLAAEVRERDTLPLDTAVLGSIHRLASPFLDTTMKFVTDFGGPLVLPVIGVIIAAVFVWRRHFRWAFIFLAGVVGASLINMILKALFQRDRPELWTRIVTENSTSFPSGHAMASSALSFALISLFWSTRWRWLVTPLALLFMLVIGFSRLYLGVHYPTDIAAAWLVSFAWVVAVNLVTRSYRRVPKTSSIVHTDDEK